MDKNSGGGTGPTAFHPLSAADSLRHSTSCQPPTQGTFCSCSAVACCQHAATAWTNEAATSENSGRHMDVTADIVKVILLVQLQPGAGYNHTGRAGGVNVTLWMDGWWPC